MAEKVVIVGGGYAGIRVMQQLSRYKEVEVTLIDQNPYHYLQTEAYALIAQQATLSDVTVDIPALCASYPQTVFVKAKVVGADFDAGYVQTEEGEIPYDYVVLAMGSRTCFPETVPGLKTYSHGVKSLPRAFEFRQKFEQELFERMRSEGDERCRSFSVVIAGAGLSGVEIAAEMADYTRRFMRKNRMLCDGVEIVLIASHDELLSGMHPYLQRKAKKRLEALGVSIVFGSRVASVEATSVTLENAESIDFDFMIFAGGIMASTLTRKLPLECTEKGQIPVTPDARVNGRDNVFAVGDVARMIGPDGKRLPATANGAEKSAELAAENILRSVRGLPLRQRTIRLEGFMVALGRYNAAVLLFDRIRFSGLAGYMMKRLITDRYKYLLDSRAYKAFRRLKRF